MTKAQILDLVERAGWTLLQALGGFLVAYQTDNVALGLVAAALGSVIKGLVAQQFGNGTAATVPAADEPILPTTADDYGSDH